MSKRWISNKSWSTAESDSTKYLISKGVGNVNYETVSAGSSKKTLINIGVGSLKWETFSYDPLLELKETIKYPIFCNPKWANAYLLDTDKEYEYGSNYWDIKYFWDLTKAYYDNSKAQVVFNDISSGPQFTTESIEKFKLNKITKIAAYETVNGVLSESIVFNVSSVSIIADGAVFGGSYSKTNLRLNDENGTMLRIYF